MNKIQVTTDTKLHMNSKTGKLVLACIRDGNFAHPGEIDAIELAFKNILKNKNAALLDVGCGLGGTADYLYEKGYHDITGIDINEETINYAKQLYPHIKFHLADIVTTHQILHTTFDIIYLISSFYAFPNKEAALAALAKVAKPSVDLLIYDYLDVNHGENSAENICGQKLPSSEEVTTLLQAAGFELVHFQDLSQYFLKCYDDFLNRLAAKKDIIIQKFGDAWYQTALTHYRDGWHKEIKENRIGGGLFHAKRK